MPMPHINIFLYELKRYFRWKNTKSPIIVLRSTIVECIFMSELITIKVDGLQCTAIADKNIRFLKRINNFLNWFGARWQCPFLQFLKTAFVSFEVKWCVLVAKKTQFRLELKKKKILKSKQMFQFLNKNSFFFFSFLKKKFFIKNSQKKLLKKFEKKKNTAVTTNLNNYFLCAALNLSVWITNTFKHFKVILYINNHAKKFKKKITSKISEFLNASKILSTDLRQQ